MNLRTSGNSIQRYSKKNQVNTRLLLTDMPLSSIISREVWEFYRPDTLNIPRVIQRLVTVNTTLSEQLTTLEARLEKQQEQFQSVEVNWESERQALQTALAVARKKLNNLENSPTSRLTRFVSTKLAALRRLLHT